MFSVPATPVVHPKIITSPVVLHSVGVFIVSSTTPGAAAAFDAFAFDNCSWAVRFKPICKDVVISSNGCSLAMIVKTTGAVANIIFGTYWGGLYGLGLGLNWLRRDCSKGEAE